jgi:hypothetical protein
MLIVMSEHAVCTPGRKSAQSAPGQVLRGVSSFFTSSRGLERVMMPYFGVRRLCYSGQSG